MYRHMIVLQCIDYCRMAVSWYKSYQIISSTVPSILDLFQRSFWKHLSTNDPTTTRAARLIWSQWGNTADSHHPVREMERFTKHFLPFRIHQHKGERGREGGRGHQLSIRYRINSQRGLEESPQLKIVTCFLQQPKKQQKNPKQVFCRGNQDDANFWVDR